MRLWRDASSGRQDRPSSWRPTAARQACRPHRRRWSDQLLAEFVVGPAAELLIFGRIGSMLKSPMMTKSSGQAAPADRPPPGRTAPRPPADSSTRLQKPHLTHPLVRADMVEMGRIEADRTQRRFDQRLQRATLEIHPLIAAVARQKQVARQPGRGSQDHVVQLEADMAALPSFTCEPKLASKFCPMTGKIVGQSGADVGHHVGAAIARVAARHLLQAR